MLGQGLDILLHRDAVGLGGRLTRDLGCQGGEAGQPGQARKAGSRQSGQGLGPREARQQGLEAGTPGTVEDGVGGGLDPLGPTLEDFGQALDHRVEKVEEEVRPRGAGIVGTGEPLAEGREGPEGFVAQGDQATARQDEGHRRQDRVLFFAPAQQAGGHEGRPALHVEAAGRLDLCRLPGGGQIETQGALEDGLLMALGADQFDPDDIVRHLPVRGQVQGVNSPEDSGLAGKEVEHAPPAGARRTASAAAAR